MIDCGGEQLVIVPLKSTDPSGTTFRHVPTLDLIAAGDAAYNSVHPRLVKSHQDHKNDEWLAALDKMQSLKPRTVVAGHKNPKNDDNGPRVIGETRQYILDLQELAGKTATAKELYDRMLARYREWLNPGSALEFGDRDKELTMCMILFAVTDNYVPALYAASPQVPQL